MDRDRLMLRWWSDRVARWRGRKRAFSLLEFSVEVVLAVVARKRHPEPRSGAALGIEACPARRWLGRRLLKWQLFRRADIEALQGRRETFVIFAPRGLLLSWIADRHDVETGLRHLLLKGLSPCHLRDRLIDL